LRFHVTQQRPDGDKHVYGARSRFVTDELLATMQQCWHGRSDEVIGETAARPGPKIDVAAKMREMW
jgi:DNA helicase-2/ATP-dependent DNA helicase PcrA